MPRRGSASVCELAKGTSVLSEAWQEFGVPREGVAVLSSWASRGRAWEASSPRRSKRHVVSLKPIQFGFSPKQDPNHRGCALPAQKPGLEPQVGMAPKPATSSVNVSGSWLPPHFCPPSHALHLNHLCSKIIDASVGQ